MFPTIQVRDAANNIVTINTIPNAGQATSDNSLPVVIASDQVVQTSPARYNANTLASNTALDLRAYTDVSVQVIGLSSPDTVTISKSINGNTYVSESVIASNGAILSNISANGIYMFFGSAYIKWDKTGASSPTITVLASN